MYKRQVLIAAAAAVPTRPEGSGPAASADAHRVEAPQQGQAPIAIGQVLRSDGLSVQRLQSRSGALVMRVGHQRWQLVPSPQALWALQQRQRSEPRQLTGTWLGFKPSVPQRRWLLKHGAGTRFVGL